MKLRVLELFGGIGACSKALKRLRIDYEITDYVEIDKYAVKSFNAIHNTNFEPQDICEWDKDIEVDLIMHGSPCQDFSLAGKQAGGDIGSGTRSSLMYETIRIVGKLRPKYVIWENVKNLLSKKHRHNFDAYLETMEKLGYKNYYQVLNAKDYGIPQNRERVFTISVLGNGNYEFPPKQELKLKLKNMLEDEVDEKYYLSDTMINFFYKNEQVQKEKGNGFKFNVTDGNVIAKTITTRAGSRMDDNFLKIKEATKLGYKEAYEGDGVNISSRMKYQRGNVQKESIQTITTSGGNERGVVVNDKPRVIGGVGEKKSNGGTQWYQQDRIYDNNVGLSLSTTAQPYYPDKQLRIRKLTPKECWRLMGFDDKDFEKAKWYSKEETNKILGKQYPKNKSKKIFSKDGKLERMSDTQLYKQAGNSIVVNVLEAILTNLLK